MTEVYVVMISESHGTHTYVDSLFLSAEDAEDAEDRMNELREDTEELEDYSTYFYMLTKELK